MKGPQPITFAELMKEVEKYQPKHGGGNYRTFTDQQNKFIIKCRTQANRISYRTMMVLWGKAGWASISRDTLIKQANKLINGKTL